MNLIKKAALYTALVGSLALGGNALAQKDGLEAKLQGGNQPRQEQVVENTYVSKIQAVFEKYQPAIIQGMGTKDEDARKKSKTAYKQMHSEMRDLARQLLTSNGVTIGIDQMIEVFPHNDKSVSIVLANQKYPDGSADCDTNATWFEVNPAKSQIRVTHLPTEWEYNDAGRIVEQRPSIEYKVK